MKIWLLAIALGLLFSGSSVALAQPSPSVTKITGKVESFNVSNISDQMISDGRQRVDLADVIMIQTGKKVDNLVPPYKVLLTAGGHVVAHSIQYEDEMFLIRSSYGDWQLPPDVVKAVVFKPQADSRLLDKILANRPLENDTVIAQPKTKQQAVGGLLESILDRKISLNYNGQSRTVDHDIIIAIVTADLRATPLTGSLATIKLVDGSVITAKIIRLQDGQLSIQLPAAASLTISWDDVSMISLQSDRIVYLSDLTPSETEQVALATVPFGWQRDQSVESNPLTLQWSNGVRKVFAKGLGTHAACRLEFENTRGFDRLVATVGIDAETAGNGDCIASIVADGIELWSAEISGKSDPVSVNLNIEGMQKITLVVRNGQHLDLGDHVDWADARFLKTR